MKVLWCWRCQMEIPMLDEEEFERAYTLYGACLRNHDTTATNKRERFQPLLDYYYSITGVEETIPNAVMHHRVAQYGPPCETCGKPYRTPRANFCAASGHKRSSDSLK